MPVAKFPSLLPAPSRPSAQELVDSEATRSVAGAGYGPGDERTYADAASRMPYALDAAVPGMQVTPYRGDWTANGFVRGTPTAPDRIFVNTSKAAGPVSGHQVAQTILHENEHLMSKRSQRDPTTEFASLAGIQPNKLGEFSEKLRALGPHLTAQYGMHPHAYFDRPAGDDGYVIKRPDIGEQMATLSALEQQSGKRLRDDPKFRAVFGNNDDMLDAYDAVTGLRQTRLDSKDLKPYTKVQRAPKAQPPAKEKSMLAKIRTYIGTEKE